AEWEYACGAGALSPWACGQAVELLGKYGWYVGHPTYPFGLIGSQPGGSLKPNDLGMFDMHGNVWEWCQCRSYRADEQAKAGKVVRDIEDIGDVNNKHPRVLRGGSTESPPVSLRSFHRWESVPSRRDSFVGFRPARTFR